MADFDEVLSIVATLSKAEKVKLMRLLAQQLKQSEHAVKPQRVLGLHAHLGVARMSDDFNAELPESFWSGDM